VNDEDLPREAIEAVIRRRGSARGFELSDIPEKALSTALYAATRGTPADYFASVDQALTDIYLIVNGVEGLAPGKYRYHQDVHGLELLEPGDFREQAALLGLGQDLAGYAAVNVYFMADLHAILGRYGNRGYRVAQLDASVAGGKLYLAAYALRLGASGLTFFDDLVTQFFSPDAAGNSVMFLALLGIPARRRRS